VLHAQHPILHYMIRECVTSNTISIAKYLPSIQPKFKQDTLCTPIRIRQKVLVSIQTEVISTDRRTRWRKLRFCTENNLHPCTVSGSRGGEKCRRQKSLLVPIFEPRRLFVLLKTLSNRKRRKIDRSVKLSLNLIDCYGPSGHLILRRHIMARGHRGSHKHPLMNRHLVTVLQFSARVI